MSTFFDNFREAASITPTGIEPVYKNANLPSPDGAVTAAWRGRVGLPFSYVSSSNDGKSKGRQSGILYLPSYEAKKVLNSGSIRKGVSDAEIYGAEINGQSLDVTGFQKLFNDKNNSDFRFDMSLAQETANNQGGDGKYKVQNSPFIQNLRKTLWGL